ncbi:MAG: hypothetical protein WCP87_03300, partial [Atribacterota bacterium]
ERSVESIAKLLSKLSSSTSEIGKRGSVLIKDGYIIMTHCHSGEAMAVIKQAWKDGKKIKREISDTRDDIALSLTDTMRKLPRLEQCRDFLASLLVTPSPDSLP